MTPLRYLIGGIPGMGKTTVGNYLRDTFGYSHINLEVEETRKEFFPNPDRYVTGLLAQDRSVVVTWGFIPDSTQTAIVCLFRSRGFTILWFDGNRGAARLAFLSEVIFLRICLIYSCNALMRAESLNICVPL